MGISGIVPARSVDDAVERIASGSLALAGGTDLVPRLKHGLLGDVPIVLIGDLRELRGLHVEGNGLRVKAATPLAEVVRSPVSPPWLRDACAGIASPRVRELATFGGALVQGRRCRYFNRPVQWRAASGPCLRTGGDRCLAGGTHCVAQQRSLLSTMLLAAGASVTMADCGGVTTRLLGDIYAEVDRGDLRLEGVMTSIDIPAVEPFRIAVEWVRRRGSIDHHDLVVAGVRRSEGWAVALGAGLPYPRWRLFTDPPGDDAANEFCDLIPTGEPGRLSAAYRRHAAAVLLRRVIARLRP